MPESFIPVWMSVGEAENFRSTLHELDDSEAGLPERELSLIEGALERERPRTYAEMDAEQKAAASPSPQAEVQRAEAVERYLDEAREPSTPRLLEEQGTGKQPPAEVVPDCDDLCTCGHLRHEHQTDPADDYTTLGCATARCPCQRFTKSAAQALDDIGLTGKQPPAEPQEGSDRAHLHRIANAIQLGIDVGNISEVAREHVKALREIADRLPAEPQGESCDDTGIYEEGSEWTPCEECERGRSLIPYFRTARKEAHEEERERIKAALEEQAEEYRREAGEAHARGDQEGWEKLTAAQSVVACVTNIVFDTPAPSEPEEGTTCGD